MVAEGKQTAGGKIVNIIRNLKSLNSKERFYLFGEATGNQNLILCRSYIEKIQNILDLRIPEEYFVGLDYHLDWIYAALNVNDINDRTKEYDNTESVVEGKQEDVDLIVAYELNGRTTIILIEAKGVGSFDNKAAWTQLDSKSKRLKKIFKDCDEKNVEPHFILNSPKQPKRIVVNADWPLWMTRDSGLGERKFYWMELKLPNDLVFVNRCAKHDQCYTKWRIRPRPVHSEVFHERPDREP